MEDNKYNKLSMSIMLDNREKTDNEMLIPKISPAIWIPSKKITTCYECKEIFGWLNRKHHCRICGRVFCGNCANNWGKVPSLVNITTPPNTSYSVYSLMSDEYRMCNMCKRKTDFIHKSSKFIYIFSNLPLNLKELYNIRLVNKEWCKSISTILASYKSCQYKLPSQSFSKLEKQFFWNHRFEFSTHFQLMSKCISSFQIENHKELEKLIIFYSKNKRSHQCRELACKRNCSFTPKIEEVLEIFNNKIFMKNKICRSWIFEKLKLFDVDNIKLIMPWIVKLGVENHQIMIEEILHFCAQNNKLIFSFYYECRFYILDNIYKQKLKQTFDFFFTLIGEKNKKNIIKTERFLDFINTNLNVINNIDTWIEASNKFFKKYKSILLPWDSYL